MENWIVQQCRRDFFQQLVTWIIVSAITFGLPLFFPRYAVAFLFGAKDLSVDQLSALEDINTLPSKRVRVHDLQAMDTGVAEFEVTTKNGQETNRKHKTELIALAVNGKAVFARVSPKTVKSSEAFSIAQLDATLKPLPDDVRQTLEGDPDLAKLLKLSPQFYLDAASYFRLYGFIYLGVAGVLALLLCTAGVWAWNGYCNPRLHPAYVRISEWGDPDEVSEIVENEYRNEVRQELKKIKITQNSLIAQKLYAFEVRRLDDLLWAYEHVTRHTALFITVSKDCEIRLGFDDKLLAYSGSNRRIQEVLAHIAERVPWAVVGFTNEIETAYRKDRKGFREAVDKRRDELAQEPALQNGT